MFLWTTFVLVSIGFIKPNLILLALYIVSHCDHSYLVVFIENDALFTFTKIGYDAVKNHFPLQLVFPVNEITFTLTAGSLVILV